MIPWKLNKKKKKWKRWLNAINYMNMGPGYMDVGSNGFSPLSLAMANPNIAQMAPFIP